MDEVTKRTVLRGAALGWIVVGVAVFALALALGADVGIAVIVGLAVGLFVGGGLGLMYAGRLSADKSR